MLRIHHTKLAVCLPGQPSVANTAAIALPSQNPLARALTTTETDPNAEPTTSRGLHLTEVLLTLRHPNAGVRKDGLTALKEVLVAGAEMGVGIGKREGETGKVIAGVVRLLGDDVSLLCQVSPAETLGRQRSQGLACFPRVVSALMPSSKFRIVLPI